MFPALTGPTRAALFVLGMLATTLPAGAQTLQPESGTLVVVNKRVNTQHHRCHIR